MTAFQYLPEPASTLVRRGNYPGAVLPRIGGFFPHSDTGLSSPCLPIRARRDCAAAGRFLSAATTGTVGASPRLSFAGEANNRRFALNLILGSQPKPDRGLSGDRRGETRTTPHSGGPSTCNLLGNRVGQTWRMMRRMGHQSVVAQRVTPRASRCECPFALDLLQGTANECARRAMRQAGGRNALAHFPHSGGPSTCGMMWESAPQAERPERRMGHQSAALRDAVKAQAPTVPAHLLATKLRPLDQHPQTYAVLKGIATAFATGVAGGGSHSPVPVHITR